MSQSSAIEAAAKSMAGWHDDTDQYDHPRWKAYVAEARAALQAAGVSERMDRLERAEVFGECISDYERLRGYLALRYGDRSTQREINKWMADNGGGLFVEGVPEADAWRERYWP